MQNPMPPSLCVQIEQWILAQMPDPTDDRAQVAAAAATRTLALIMPPIIRELAAPGENSDSPT